MTLPGPPPSVAPPAPAALILNGLTITIGFVAFVGADAALNLSASLLAQVLYLLAFVGLMALALLGLLPRPPRHGGVPLFCPQRLPKCQPEQVLATLGHRRQWMPWCPHRTEVAWHPDPGELVVTYYRALPQHRPASLQEYADARHLPAVALEVDITAGADERRTALSCLAICLGEDGPLPRTVRWRLAWSIRRTQHHRVKARRPRGATR